MKNIRTWTMVAALAVSGSAFGVGSIAIDDQMGDDEPAYGIATGEDTKEVAQRNAVKYCKEYGGRNCRSVVWFETCGAVAVTKKVYGYGYGKTKAVATAKALEMCGKNNCNIVAAECE